MRGGQPDEAGVGGILLPLKGLLPVGSLPRLTASTGCLCRLVGLFALSQTFAWGRDVGWQLH